MRTKAKTITARQLHDTLSKIKVGGAACHYSLKKCGELTPIINEINQLKQNQNAIILAHSYVAPDIIYGVADFVGDSYGLSKDALSTSAEKIIFAAVRFMGETAQILNPHKEVLIPATDPGCTLADAITDEEVRRLRKEYPDYAFVCYVNTTAEVKAECDVCVTSANIYHIIEKMPNKKIYFLPDKLMGQNLIDEMKERGINKEIAFYKGTCVVHEEFTKEEVLHIRSEYPDVKVVSHPECKPEVCEISDYVGSTSQMLKYMRTADGDRFLMFTECGLSSRMEVEFAGKEFVGSCRLCKYMKSNTLSDILRVLKNPTDKDRVLLDENIRKRALTSLEAMFAYTK
ncbi:MAG: quinolinate synthase NadA [Candidatus Omnitrophica bacterium]|nr:quinolinate synthase NadA [Candidatus Omnitrophota bacterium]